MIVCAITSNIKKKPYSFLLTEKDVEKSVFKETSVIKIDALLRIKKDLIIKKIDILKDSVFLKILKILESIFR